MSPRWATSAARSAPRFSSTRTRATPLPGEPWGLDRLRKPGPLPSAVAGQQVPRLLRPPGPLLVGLDVPRLVEQRLDDSPRVLDRRLAGEQLRVAVERVVEEALVGLGLIAYLRLEQHIEMDPLEGVLAGLLHEQLQLRARVGLDAKHQLVGVGHHASADPEPRGLLEYHPHLGHLRGHHLPRPD